jgi:hypothetical protein
MNDTKMKRERHVPLLVHNRVPPDFGYDKTIVQVMLYRMMQNHLYSVAAGNIGPGYDDNRMFDVVVIIPYTCPMLREMARVRIRAGFYYFFDEAVAVGDCNYHEQ